MNAILRVYSSCIAVSHYRREKDISIRLNQQKQQEYTHNQGRVHCPRLDGNSKDLGLHREIWKRHAENIETSLQLPLHLKSPALGSHTNTFGIAWISKVAAAKMIATIPMAIKMLSSVDFTVSFNILY